MASESQVVAGTNQDLIALLPRWENSTTVASRGTLIAGFIKFLSGISSITIYRPAAGCWIIIALDRETLRMVP